MSINEHKGTVESSSIIDNSTVVKNNGSIEVLTNTEKYGKLHMWAQYIRLIKKNVRQGTKREYDHIVSKLINEAEKEGMLIWLKK